MYSNEGLSVKESFAVVLMENLKIGVKRHKRMKRDVNRFIYGKTCSKLFLTRIVFSFLHRFSLDFLFSAVVCKLVGVPFMYLWIYIVTRTTMFIGNIVSIFIDELTE